MTPSAFLYGSVGESLTGYIVDTEHAELLHGATMALPDTVQYAWPHPSGRVLYVATSCQGPVGGAGVGHHLAALSIDPVTGELAPLGTAQSLSHRPIHLTVDRQGRHVLIAYCNPSHVSVHRLEPDGSLGAPVPQAPDLDFGIYAHQVLALPSGKTVLVVARGHNATADKAEDPGALKLYHYDDGVLRPKQTVAPNGGYGFGPRHADFHPTRPWLYVSLERQNQLALFTFDDDDRLSGQASCALPCLADPATVRPRQMLGPIHVHPDGRHVYVANRCDKEADEGGVKVFAGGENNLAVFALDGDTGAPSLAGHVDPRNMHVRTFSIDPSGRLLVAAAIRPMRVREGAALREVPAALSVFRIGADGMPDFVRKYDIDLGPRPQWWTGIVGQP